mmetsp:Transcript_1557/g.5661  ORF Transcript_1557/g.5661 Transcript_1557/m.5661 type:complete len:363 (+) Transcript_1557:1876-2964(+)
MPLLSAMFHNNASARKNSSCLASSLPSSLGKDIFIGDCPPPFGDFFGEFIIFVVDVVVSLISIGSIAKVCLSNSVITSLELNSGIDAAFFSTSLFVPRAFRKISICASLYSSSSSAVGIDDDGITPKSLLRTLSKAARISPSASPSSSSPPSPSSSASSFTNAAMNTFSDPTLLTTSFVSSTTSSTLSLSTKIIITSNSRVFVNPGAIVTLTLCGSIFSMHSNANRVDANFASPVISKDKFPSATATKPSKAFASVPISSSFLRSSFSFSPFFLFSSLSSSSLVVPFSRVAFIANCNCIRSSFRIDGKSFVPHSVGDLIGNGGIGFSFSLINSLLSSLESSSFLSVCSSFSPFLVVFSLVVI